MKPRRAALIFNPSSGSPADSPRQLLAVLLSLQDLSIEPVVYLTRANQSLDAFIQRSLAAGIDLFIVCGGDGTIGAAARILAGSDALLSIIPTGTQNNIALSLGIPTDVAAAAGLLRQGTVRPIDVGQVTTPGMQRPFIEVCSLGLISALFPSADHIQHGSLASIGDFLSLLVSTPVANFSLLLDDQRQIQTSGHSVLVSNMPYFGPHFQIAPDASCRDGLLGVMIFNDITRLDLLDYALPLITGEEADPDTAAADPRLQHFHVRKVSLSSDPPLPILVDGDTLAPLAQGSLTLQVRPQALKVFVGLEQD